MLRTSWWWTLRHPVSVTYLLVAGMAGSLAVEPGYSPALAFESGVAVAVSVLMYFGPLVFAVTFGALTDAGAEQNRLLGGSSLASQRLAQMACASVIVTGGALMALAIVSMYGLLVTADPGNWTAPDVPVGRAVVRLILVAAAVTVVCTIAMLGRSTVAALGAAAAVLTTTLIVEYSAIVDWGLLLRVGWPPYAAKVVSLTGLSYSLTVGVVASAGLVGWLCLAGWLLVTPRSTVHDRGPGRPAARSGRVMLAIAVVAFVGLTAIGPGFAERVPASVRPSLWMQSLAGEAPDQVTGDFFEALQLGEGSGVAAIAAPTFRDQVDELPAYLLRRSSDQRFFLVSSPTIRSAEVEAYLVAGKFFVCLSRLDDQWLVTGVSTERCQA